MFFLYVSVFFCYASGERGPLASLSVCLCLSVCMHVCLCVCMYVFRVCVCTCMFLSISLRMIMICALRGGNNLKGLSLRKTTINIIRYEWFPQYYMQVLKKCTIWIWMDYRTSHIEDTSTGLYGLPKSYWTAHADSKLLWYVSPLKLAASLCIRYFV